MKRSTWSFLTIKTSLNPFCNIVDRIEFLDLEALHRVSVLVELEGEGIFLGGGKPDVRGLAGTRAVPTLTLVSP